MHRKRSLFFAVWVALLAAQRVAEAPAGFDTPTLAVNTGSQSVSNGVAEPPGDTFTLDQAEFERKHDASQAGTGLVRSSTQQLAPSAIRTWLQSHSGRLPHSSITPKFFR